jgi:hypothetical protein
MRQSTSPTALQAYQLFGSEEPMTGLCRLAQRRGVGRRAPSIPCDVSAGYGHVFRSEHHGYISTVPVETRRCQASSASARTPPSHRTSPEKVAFDGEAGKTLFTVASEIFPRARSSLQLAARWTYGRDASIRPNALEKRALLAYRTPWSKRSAGVCN